MVEDKRECHGGDFAVPGPQNEDGSVSVVRHGADHQVSVGTLRPLREGQPITGEVIRLEPRGDGTFSMEKLCDAPEGHGKGPAIVNSQGYRDNWDRIWGSKKSSAPN